MDYNKLLDAHIRHGSTADDICRYALSVEREQIRENVVLAPCWVPQSMPELGNITLLSLAKNAAIKVYDVECTNGKKFSYINTGIGGPMVTEAVLALGTTKCKNLLLLGSAGSSDENVNIGDLVVAESAINGLGTPFYMEDEKINSQNLMGKAYYPDEELKNRLINVVEKTNCKIYPVFSTDSVFCQFCHMQEIIDSGAKVIDMEASAVFCAT